MARMINCVKLGREAEGLEFPPVPGELGKRIWENVSKEAWAGWLKHQTMLVNENRLNLADQRARQYLARQMENHFFGGGADAPQGYVPPPAEEWPKRLSGCPTARRAALVSTTSIAPARAGSNRPGTCSCAAATFRTPGRGNRSGASWRPASA